MYWVWYISPTDRENARNLDPFLLLGYCTNQEDVSHLMDVMGQVQENLVPHGRTARKTRSVQRQPSPDPMLDA